MQTSFRYLVTLVALVATAFTAVQATPVPVSVPTSLLLLAGAHLPPHPHHIHTTAIVPIASRAREALSAPHPLPRPQARPLAPR